MTEEQLNQRREFAELRANPKNKGCHSKCKRCGKRIYTPMPCNHDIQEFGTFTFTTLIIAHLVSRGWRVVGNNTFDGYFVCGDCLKEDDKEFINPSKFAIKANEKYVEFVDKMREKYKFYDE